MSHFTQSHKHYEELMKNSGQFNLKFIVSDKARNLYGWLDWIIVGGYPFNFVENKVNQKYSTLTTICTTTFTTYLQKLTQQVEKNITEKLPE